jgi:hypothetical protein
MKNFNKLTKAELISQIKGLKENSPFYKNKYFIYGVIFVASCMTYYYFGEDLKIYSISL